MKFNVKHDVQVFRPRKWDGIYTRRFGAKNEGFTIVAESMEQAKEVLRSEYNLNPFYLKITAID